MKNVTMFAFVEIPNKEPDLDLWHDLEKCVDEWVRQSNFYDFEIKWIIPIAYQVRNINVFQLKNCPVYIGNGLAWREPWYFLSWFRIYFF